MNFTWDRRTQKCYNGIYIYPQKNRLRWTNSCYEIVYVTNAMKKTESKSSSTPKEPAPVTRYMPSITNI
jgi:hypothetical protein